MSILSQTEVNEIKMEVKKRLAKWPNDKDALDKLQLIETVEYLSYTMSLNKLGR